MKADMDRAQAFAQLLAHADPRGLRLGHGPFVAAPRFASIERRRRLVWQPLMIRWQQHRCLALDPVPCIGNATPAMALVRKRA